MMDRCWVSRRRNQKKESGTKSIIYFCHWLCLLSLPSVDTYTLCGKQDPTRLLNTTQQNKYPWSKWVPIRFPMCSPRMFPMTPRLNPICFAQTPPLLAYIAGPKGKTLHKTIEPSILWFIHSFNFYLWLANQIGSFPKKIKIGWSCDALTIN